MYRHVMFYLHKLDNLNENKLIIEVALLVKQLVQGGIAVA